MTQLLYTIVIYLYGILIKVAAIFSAKAQKWRAGRENFWRNLDKQLGQNQEPVIWFHCASLGEFEQARPLIEKLKVALPKSKQFRQVAFKICVTFFSPSGYEVRKDYAGADYICYLPLDTPSNARRFVEKLQPVAVFWVKYEFWYHHLSAIQKAKVPLFLFSAVFRPNQYFFKFYGAAFRRLLGGFSHIFVQDEASKKLLKRFEIAQVSQAGDTRFDRVATTAKKSEPLPEIELFKGEQKLLVVGSCWAKDLDVLLPFLKDFDQALKVVIAPHEIHESTLRRIETTLKQGTLRFSQASESLLQSRQFLLIDNVGMLAKIYKYGDFAYVGGAFGEGLHNILEPAVFAMPVFFGKDYRKFPEAVALLEKGGAFSVRNSKEIGLIFKRLYHDEALRQKVGGICQAYIQNNVGGARKIVQHFVQTQEA